MWQIFRYSNIEGSARPFYKRSLDQQPETFAQV